MNLSDTIVFRAAVAATIPSVAIAQTEAMKPGTSVDVSVDRMEVGAAPEDFDFWRTGQGGPGKWVVVTAASAAGGKAIRFTVSFDGKELFTARDKTLVEPGKVALWTKADSVTEFEGLSIKAIE
jgi:hypothetical protein